MYTTLLYTCTILFFVGTKKLSSTSTRISMENILQSWWRVTWYSTCSVSTVAPIIPSNVSPLKDALRASQVIRQFVVSLKNLVPRSRIVPSRSVFGAKEVLVQAFLVNFFVSVSHRARTKFEVAMMIRRELYSNWYHRPSSVLPDDHTISVLAACLVRTWLK